MSVTLKHNGLPENVNRFDLLSMVRDIASELKLTGREVQYLEAAIRRCSDLDFEKGSICAVWPKVATIAKKLSCTPRQINSIEKSLEKKKLIARTTGPNGHRFGVRGLSEKISFAAGVNLAPMIARYGEFINLKDVTEMHEQTLAATRSEIQLCRRKLRDSKNAVLVEKCEQILPRGRASIVHDLERLCSIHEALLALLRQIETEPSLAETSNGQAESSDASEVSGRPNIQTHNLKNICIAPKLRAPKPISSRQMLLIASPQYRELVQMFGGPTPENFIEASSRICAELDISTNLWGEACQTFGRERAAHYVLILDRNRHLPVGHKYHRKNPGGSLVCMIRKSGGNFNLNGLLRAAQGYQEGCDCDVSASLPSIVEQTRTGVKSVGSLLSNILANYGSDLSGDGS